MELIEVEEISLVESGTVVLHPLSFKQQKGSRLAIAGESGAGKSTLLQVIAGLVQPTTGEIRIAGSRVRGPAVALVPGHPGVAYLSQKSDLPKFLRVEQVLRYISKQPAKETQAIYSICRIEHLLGRRTDELSGGEQQRVALARLLLGGPSLLLLDEPFSNLDRVHKQAMQGIVEEVGQQVGITCVLVSHDATDTLSWADEIMVLQRGKVVQRGTPQRIYKEPATEYVAGLFGDYNLVRGADQALLLPHGPINKALLVRPEQLRLEAAEGGGARGVVRVVRFFGSYYEVGIQLLTTLIRVRTDEVTVTEGQVVTVTLAAGGGWLME
jgi:iron(III) transport system ATP-binding protein